MKKNAGIFRRLASVVCSRTAELSKEQSSVIENPEQWLRHGRPQWRDGKSNLFCSNPTLRGFSRSVTRSLKQQGSCFYLDSWRQHSNGNVEEDSSTTGARKGRARGGGVGSRGGGGRLEGGPLFSPQHVETIGVELEARLKLKLSNFRKYRRLLREAGISRLVSKSGKADVLERGRGRKSGTGEEEGARRGKVSGEGGGWRERLKER